MPRVTVVTAVYNTEPYLRAAVESVAGQTRRPVEHILINDGSTDGSLAAAKQLAHEFPHVRVIQHDANQGYPAALNTGIAATKTEYVAILDSDDIAMPHWLATVVPVLDAGPGIACAGGGAEIITADGERTGCKRWVDPSGDVTQDILNGHYRILHPGSVHRRSFLMAVGGYNPRLKSLEDCDIFLSLTAVGRVINVGKPLIFYRRLPNSESRKSPEFDTAAKKYLETRGAMLRRGLSVQQVNATLFPVVSALATLPRLVTVTGGAYELEMAKAFEEGGKKIRAALVYVAAFKKGASVNFTVRGLVRCLLPPTVVNWLKSGKRGNRVG